MRAFPEITDPVFEKKNLNGFEKYFLTKIRDERDLPFIYLIFKITMVMVPSAILLYLPVLNGMLWWSWAVVHLILCLVVFMGPYTLMLHNTSHRPFFKREYDIWNKYIPWFLGIFMGQSPDLYFIHHMGMHHNEGNMPEDKSSTMPFQRDSFLGFLHYYFRFMFIGIIELAQYFFGKKKKSIANKAAIKEYSYTIILILLCVFVNLGASMAVFVIPLILVRLGMMSGNWGQHSFVDPENPSNDYTNSITCINATYNQKCFNDGYHIGHHLVPNMHWTDMPGELQKNLQKYADNKALIFDGLDFHMVWLNLMLKRYKWLASHVVNINGNTFESEEEIIEIMKQRTRRFSKEQLKLHTQ
ncbi:MAG: fatty acid desaturase [Saprospiraceae bacterium]|nr:fatty acid desaturase [Saprospiraceae bacterium]